MARGIVTAQSVIKVYTGFPGCEAIKKADAAVYDQLRMMVRPGPSDFDLKMDSWTDRIWGHRNMKMWTPDFQLFALRRDEMGRYVLTFIQMLHVSQAGEQFHEM